MAKLIFLVSLFGIVSLFALGCTATTRTVNLQQPDNIINFNDPKAHLSVVLENTVGTGGGYDWTARDSTFASLRIIVGTCKGDLNDESSFVSSFVENVTCANSGDGEDGKHCVTVEVRPDAVAAAFAFSSKSVRSERGNRHVLIDIHGVASASYFGIQNLVNCRGTDVPTKSAGHDELHRNACVAFSMPLNTTGTPTFTDDSMFFFDTIEATYVPTEHKQARTELSPFRILSYDITSVNAVTNGGILWHRGVRVIRGESQQQQREGEQSSTSPSLHQSMAIGGRFDGGVASSQLTCAELVDVFPLIESGTFTQGAKVIIGRIEGTLRGSNYRAVFDGPFVNADFTDSILKMYKIKTTLVSFGRFDQNPSIITNRFSGSNVSIFEYTALPLNSESDPTHISFFEGVFWQNIALSKASIASVYDCSDFNGGLIYVNTAVLSEGSVFTIEENKNVSTFEMSNVRMTNCDRATASCGVFVQRNSFRIGIFSSFKVEDSLFLINANTAIPYDVQTLGLPTITMLGDGLSGNGAMSIINNNGFAFPFTPFRDFEGDVEMWANAFATEDITSDYYTFLAFENSEGGASSSPSTSSSSLLPSRVQFSSMQAPILLIGRAVAVDPSSVFGRIEFGCANVSYRSARGDILPFPSSSSAAALTPCEDGKAMRRCVSKLSFDDASLINSQQLVKSASVPMCVQLAKTIPPWQDKSTSPKHSKKKGDARTTTAAPKPPRRVIVDMTQHHSEGKDNSAAAPPPLKGGVRLH